MRVLYTVHWNTYNPPPPSPIHGGNIGRCYLGGGGICEKWEEKREENANEKEGKTKGKGKLKLKGERLSQKGCLMFKGG